MSNAEDEFDVWREDEDVPEFDVWREDEDVPGGDTYKNESPFEGWPFEELTIEELPIL